ncbi:MAG: radical SAM protein [Thaumarchaeota archaeon]|nr:radical SAM protein [Nitrososphaerota archaeon]MCL5317737.1 radical SAM protein [Nitrososphaerota archaeon]
MISFNRYSVWQNSEVRTRLNWYYEVMRDIKPAKFLVAKRIPYKGDLEQTSIEALWTEHQRLSQRFKRILKAVQEDRLILKNLPEPDLSLLDVKTELLNRMLRRCEFCEWRCKVDRVKGDKMGACRVGLETRVSTWFHHYGEEPPLTTGQGSGTIFFAGCTFRCVFCQNWDISQNPSNGVVADGRKLALIMKGLREAGAANINFVGGDPTPNLHTILDSTRHLNINVPLLWNSNLYLTPEAMSILTDVIDIWLPDFKWGSDHCALQLSKIPNYWEVISRNHLLAQRDGDMIIRHLVMPGHTECCTKPILKWIAANCPRALVNIMGQYHPDYMVPANPKYRDINRCPTDEEINKAYRYADQLGIIYRPIS